MTLTPLWAQTNRPILIISPISTGKRTALLNSITEGEGIEDSAHNSDITILTGKEPLEELRERVQAISSHRPYSLKNTYLVCENLHGLSKHTADTLLKLLEKPPAHLKIGLTATTLVGVQRTILSRALVIRAPAGEIPKAKPPTEPKKISEAGHKGVQLSKPIELIPQIVREGTNTEPVSTPIPLLPSPSASEVTQSPLASASLSPVERFRLSGEQTPQVTPPILSVSEGLAAVEPIQVTPPPVSLSFLPIEEQPRPPASPLSVEERVQEPIATASASISSLDGLCGDNSVLKGALEV